MYNFIFSRFLSSVVVVVRQHVIWRFEGWWKSAKYVIVLASLLHTRVKKYVETYRRTVENDRQENRRERIWAAVIDGIWWSSKLGVLHIVRIIHFLSLSFSLGWRWWILESTCGCYWRPPPFTYGRDTPIYYMDSRWPWKIYGDGERSPRVRLAYRPANRRYTLQASRFFRGLIAFYSRFLLFFHSFSIERFLTRLSIQVTCAFQSVEWPHEFEYKNKNHHNIKS